MSIVNIVLVSLAAYMLSVIFALAFYACAVRPYWKMSDDVDFCVNHTEMIVNRAIQISAMARKLQTVCQIIFTVAAFALAFS